MEAEAVVAMEAETVAATALVEMQAVTAGGAVAALPAASAGRQDEAHHRSRRDKRCRLKAASPVIAERRVMLRGTRCRREVA